MANGYDCPNKTLRRCEDSSGNRRAFEVGDLLTSNGSEERQTKSEKGKTNVGCGGGAETRLRCLRKNRSGLTNCFNKCFFGCLGVTVYRTVELPGDPPYNPS